MNVIALFGNEDQDDFIQMKRIVNDYVFIFVFKQICLSVMNRLISPCAGQQRVATATRSRTAPRHSTTYCSQQFY